MALFNKLFSSSNKRKAINSGQSPNYLSKFPFDSKQVRILLYRESDSSGRRLLFDSNAIQKVVINDLEEPHLAQDKANNHRGKTDENKFKNHHNGFIEINNGIGYKHNRPTSADITSIGEMVFGALAMSFRGTALKIHWLQTPSRVLCSQVFLSPINTKSNVCYPSADSLSPRHSITSDQGSIDNFSMNSFSMPFTVCVSKHLSFVSERARTSNPLDVPNFSLENNITSGYSGNYSTGDSGYSTTTCHDPWATVTSSSSYQYSTRSSLGSILSNPDSLRKYSIDSSSIQSSKSSDGSLQRRISRNLLTSFENRNSVSDFIGFIGDNYQTETSGGSEGCVTRFRRPSDPNESKSNPEIFRRRGASGDVLLPKVSTRRAKLGLAVCITMSESFEEEMEQFCCEHIALLESMLCRLRASAENAYTNHKDFLQIMLHAWQSTTEWIVDLFTAPRLVCPVWLSITTSGNKYSKNLADHFMHELCWMLSLADTKATNFFVSTMLTGILTHHLGWVTTVAAFNSKSKAHAAAIAVEQRAKLMEVSQKHPYNALWAQMGDLYGAIGCPPKLSRTIIYGPDKLSLEKLLHILTYFIRCGEVRRTMKKENLKKDLIDNIINQKPSESSGILNYNLPKKTSGLSRTPTFKNNLSSMVFHEKLNDLPETDVNIHKKNDIPNVLAYRDSRFVQQELRIGNFLMDTGIEKNSTKANVSPKNTDICPKTKEKIRLTITTPENIEMNVDGIETDSVVVAEFGVVEEAIEVDENDVPNDLTSRFFWGIEPKIKEGLSFKDLEKLQIGAKIINKKLERRTQSSAELNGNQDTFMELRRNNQSHISLSDLITANSVGKSDRLTWGIEPIKETVSLEEHKHFEICQQLVEKERSIIKDNGNGVVFVLGDNEALVNIKKSTETLHESAIVSSSSIANISTANNTKIFKPPSCGHHKKHSGVKFNFEQYPQIATNYMKNKNLDLTNYDFFEKSSKLENVFNCGAGTSATTAFPTVDENNTQDTFNENCELCKNTCSTAIYQTPSNATELEFETDDDNCYRPSNGDFPKMDNSINGLTEGKGDEEKRKLKIARENNFVVGDLNLISLPVPGLKDDIDDDSSGDMKVKAGYVPSLLLGVSDHYIPDMVLQGTLQSPSKWEFKLQEDLALASHCASIIANPAENVAVVADMDKWDVKIVTSQTHTMPYTATNSSPVGMSQLVSSMLETVYAMSVSGISAYECLSFLESKLQEMYLQSESLAAFLLATEFCSLSTVTSALNLSANDVPLLLSVASIHSPQVTRKVGVSFR